MRWGMRRGAGRVPGLPTDLPRWSARRGLSATGARTGGGARRIRVGGTPVPEGVRSAPRARRTSPLVVVPSAPRVRQAPGLDGVRSAPRPSHAGTERSTRFVPRACRRYRARTKPPRASHAGTDGTRLSARVVAGTGGTKRPPRASHAGTERSTRLVPRACSRPGGGRRGIPRQVHVEDAHAVEPRASSGPSPAAPISRSGRPGTHRDPRLTSPPAWHATRMVTHPPHHPACTPRVPRRATPPESGPVRVTGKPIGPRPGRSADRAGARFARCGCDSARTRRERARNGRCAQHVTRAPQVQRPIHLF